jgi:tripartite-type tricarboxylate transporter receptor subunit TctC
MHATGTEFVHVPYNGAGLSVQDLLGGHVKVSFDTTPDLLGTDGARTASPEAFAEMFRSDLARFAQVVKAAGIRIE